MSNVFNWQIGREMEYPYDEVRPKTQLAFVFDLNKCIACQTCTLACKTTWTTGKGQEYMFWNNVESKPWGFYPLAWDLKLLKMLGGQEWEGEVYKGKTIFEAAPKGETLLGHLPDESDWAYPNIGEDDASEIIEMGRHFSGVHASWLFYLPRICNHCTFPGCLAACPRKVIYKRGEDGIVLIDQERCRGYQECVKGCPYKKPMFNLTTRVSEKCIGCFPFLKSGIVSRCVTNCIGKIRLEGFLSQPKDADPENPVDFLVHIRKVALPLYPQFGTEPNVYYIPPVHVPEKFLAQMFGPGAPKAVAAYRNTPEDLDLAATLILFGCTNKVTRYFRRDTSHVMAYDEKKSLTVRVPLKEPVYIRPYRDEKRNAYAHNIT